MESEYRVVSVACNHCGAPLEINTDTRFVTCSHCGSRLAVVETGSSRFTKAVDELGQKLEIIEAQNELARIDREFQIAAEDTLISDRQGRRSRPSVMGGVVTIVMAIVFGGFWTAMAAKMAPFMAIFGAVFILVGVISGATMCLKASSYQEANERREAERRHVLNRLESLRNSTRD